MLPTVSVYGNHKLKVDAVLVVGVSVYQIFRINYSPVDTEIALETTVDNAVTVEGFVVRDESYIRADAAGTLVPLVTDGHRVASGDAVAVVFGSEEAARNYTELQQVEEDIAYFEPFYLKEFVAGKPKKLV